MHEEYAIIRILRLQTAGQSLVTHEGSSFDVMKVRPQKSDETFEIYFNIDLPHSWLQRQFGAAK